MRKLLAILMAALSLSGVLASKAGAQGAPYIIGSYDIGWRNDNDGDCHHAVQHDWSDGNRTVDVDKFNGCTGTGFNELAIGNLPSAYSAIYWQSNNFAASSSLFIGDWNWNVYSQYFSDQYGPQLLGPPSLFRQDPNNINNYFYYGYTWMKTSTEVQFNFHTGSRVCATGHLCAQVAVD